MKDLLKAITILCKYANDDRNPTYCDHDTLLVYAGITKDIVSEEDVNELSELGFDWSEDRDCFYSFRYGSC